ncbi:MAG: class I SAM-dependent methyltransferase [Hyphomicrobiaceae bacterium]|nr:class I SAM-dependent methyltransferase [Hyphomicrobiaceae bacterium]
MLYWVGNAAKARVIEQILNDRRPNLTVFDYGAGSGGDWPDVLATRPGLELVCYEPSEAASRILRERVAGARARVLDSDEFEKVAIQADYIVSFSVLEHVHDKPAYLSHAKRHLAPDGTFYLNYDDGHFRTSLDLDELRGWRTNLAVTAQNRLAWLWPRVNKIERYQSRVTADAIQELIARAGFSVKADRYENLASFKSLAKTMPADRGQEFMRFWLEVEDQLNSRFQARVEPRMGDAMNLWREMGSRTLTLCHA